MNNPLVTKVADVLERRGFNNAELVRESYDPEYFGNALAIYKVGNLYLKFLRDRDDDTLSVIDIEHPRSGYIWDDIAVVLGLVTLVELVANREHEDVCQPPKGVEPLEDQVALFKQHDAVLQRIFAPAEVEATFVRLGDAARKRCRVVFREGRPD